MSDAPPGTPAEAAVAALQDMGFAEDQCREALRLSGNQVRSLLCLGARWSLTWARAVAGLQTELAMEWLLQQAAVRDSPAGGETPGEESFVADQDVRAPPVPPRARSGSRRL